MGSFLDRLAAQKRAEDEKRRKTPPKDPKCPSCGTTHLEVKDVRGMDKPYCVRCQKVVENTDWELLRARRIKVRDLLHRMHHIDTLQGLGAIPKDARARAVHMLNRGYTKGEHEVSGLEQWRHHSGKHTVAYHTDAHKAHAHRHVTGRKYLPLHKLDVFTGKREESMEKTDKLVDRIESVTEKFWIQQAISKPGALRAQLHVKGDKPIPAGKLASAAKKGGKLGARARLAQTLKKLHK